MNSMSAELLLGTADAAATYGRHHRAEPLDDGTVTAQLPLVIATSNAATVPVHSIPLLPVAFAGRLS
jgi:hypothetical protein